MMNNMTDTATTLTTTTRIDDEGDVEASDSTSAKADTIPAPPPKSCSCGVTYDHYDWAHLPILGTMSEGALELRNCSACGSTLAVEVST